MTINQLLGGLVVYHLIKARLRYRGAQWLLFVFLVVSFIGVYYALSRLSVVWPYRGLRWLARG